MTKPEYCRMVLPLNNIWKAKELRISLHSRFEGRIATRYYMDMGTANCRCLEIKYAAETGPELRKFLIKSRLDDDNFLNRGNKPDV